MSLSISSAVTLNNGVAMPLFGFGTFRLSPGHTTQAAVQEALAMGYRLIDTAAAYGNEEEVGKAVAGSEVDRRDVFITTKVWIDDQGYEETLAAFQRSLQRLRLDYLDLYLIHWPARGRWPDSWRAMLTLLEQGVCRAIGVSNFEIHHLEELRRFSPLMPAVNQVEFSPFLYRHNLLDYCREHGIQLEAYSSLTHGEKLNDPTLVEIAAKYGKTPAQILLRWPLQHEVVVIPKSAHPARIRENAELFDFEISPEDMAALDALNEDFYTLSADWRAQFA